MADIKLSLFNQALVIVGEDAVSELDSTNLFIAACLEHYERLVGEEIETGNWKFASKDATPTLLTAQAESPLQYQFQMPADLKTLQAVMFKDFPLDGADFEIDGRVIRCRYNTDVTIKYLFRADESVWPDRFRTIIVRGLQAIMLRRNEDHGVAAQIEEGTEIKKIVAKHAESGQRRNRPLGDGTVVQRRRGQIFRPRWGL